MGVYELIATAIDNSLTGNICTPFEACGMAEIMGDGKQFFPVTSDRTRKKIMPSQTSRLTIYHRFAGPEERDEPDGDSFGLQVNQEFSREMIMVGIGLSELIHKECSLNDADLAQSVADQFPTEAEPTTTVNNVQIRITAIEINKTLISGAEWQSVEMGHLFPKLSMFKISYTIEGVYCQDSCGGSTVNICADVQVTDTDDTVHNIPSGGAYTCTNPNVQNPLSVVWDNFEDTAEVNGYGAISGAQVYNAHSLQKDFTGTAGLNAGASSNQVVTSVKGTLSMDAFESVAIGLNLGPPAFIATPGLSDLDHCFYFTSASNGKIELRESGVDVSAGSLSFPLTSARALRTDIEWEVRFTSGKIQYYWNGVLDKTSAVAYPPASTFSVYAILYQPGSKLTTVEWVL